VRTRSGSPAVTRTSAGSCWARHIGSTVTGSGDNHLIGSQFANRLEAGSGDDVIEGGHGNDVLIGGNGADTMRGGYGADVIEGGNGADILRWGFGDVGTDVVIGFQLGIDKIAIDTAFFGNNLGSGDTAQDVLFAFLAPDGGSTLMAHAFVVGWTRIAQFEGIAPSMLADAIQNGTLFHAEAGVLSGGAADQLFF
jgi:Ca2+-binding RTX toxin-like protein